MRQPLRNCSQHIEPEDIKGKFIALDILAKDLQGQLYNIEMQVRRYDAWSARSTYYQTLKPVIGRHLADWITLFEHWQEDNTMQNVEYAPVQQALDRLKGLSADAETRQRAWVRERALLDENTAINAATARGMQQGMQQGMQHEARTMLERLLSKRFGDLGEETHLRLQNATLEQLNHWADCILDAPTLSAVFDGH